MFSIFERLLSSEDDEERARAISHQHQHRRTTMSFTKAASCMAIDNEDGVVGLEYMYIGVPLGDSVHLGMGTSAKRLAKK